MVLALFWILLNLDGSNARVRKLVRLSKDPANNYTISDSRLRNWKSCSISCFYSLYTNYTYGHCDKHVWPTPVKRIVEQITRSIVQMMIQAWIFILCNFMRKKPLEIPRWRPFPKMAARWPPIAGTEFCEEHSIIQSPGTFIEYFFQLHCHCLS